MSKYQRKKEETQEFSRIYPYLQSMFDDARAEGLQLFVAAGYRTEEIQSQGSCLEEYIEQLK